jgi:hypothetical protein
MTRLIIALIISAALTGAFYMNTAFSSDHDFTKYNKARFTIEFEVQQMGLNIRLNDIPVFNIDNTGFMTLEVPVNQYILNGDNEIKVIAHPLFDDEGEQTESYISDTEVKVGLYVREDGESTENRRLIDQVLIKPEIAYIEDSRKPVAKFIGSVSNESHTPLVTTKDAQILDYPDYGVFKKQVVTTWTVKNIKTTFPRWSWQDGIDISDNESTYESLLQAYGELHQAFATHDLDAVKSIVKYNSRERAIAFHLNDEEAGFDNLSLEKYINHSTIKLYEDLALDGAKLEILANGKLARIMDGGDIQPILFVNHETELFYQPQFLWYLNKQNNWVQIR